MLDLCQIIPFQQRYPLPERVAIFKCQILQAAMKVLSDQYIFHRVSVLHKIQIQDFSSD